MGVWRRLVGLDHVNGRTVRLLCMVPLLLGMSASSPENPICLDVQEVVRKARRTTTLFANPQPDADSIGFVSQDAMVTVLTCAEAWCQVRTAVGVGFVVDSLLAPPSAAPARTVRPARRCCRICSKGKACGNSCIARNRTCRQPAGCACNGGDSLE